MRKLGEYVICPASRLFAIALLAGCLGVAFGCGPPPPVGNAKGVAASRPFDIPGGESTAPQFLAMQAPRVFYLDVYQVAVPFGAVSGNSDFWRHVDELLIDPPVRDLLLRNGLRAGIAPADDWDFFRETIEQHPHYSRSGSAVATGTGTVELPMRNNVPEETIWFLSEDEQPRGRTYEKCNNLFGVTFFPDPRRLGEMRFSLSPTVRATRSHMELTAHDGQFSVTEVTPEYLYDLNLHLNIPKNRFLVIGLAPDGRYATTVGHQFLTLEGGPEMKEQLLIFVPRIPSRKPPAATRNVPNLNAARSP